MGLTQVAWVSYLAYVPESRVTRGAPLFSVSKDFSRIPIVRAFRLRVCDVAAHDKLQKGKTEV